MAPVATVEQVGFKKLLKMMDPRYELPSRNYFAREALPQMYTDVRQSLADRLANMTHFGLTSDMWSSRTCEPYMSVTVHFIQDWEMKTACLQTSYFPQDHTGEHIAEALQDAIASWKLQEKHLVAITTDNESNIVKAVELNEWLRMQCFGHRLHLAIGHGMNDKRVTRAISLCKRIVSCFSYSWKKRRHLAEVQIQLGLPSHQLITESATRWGSRQQMIERVLEQEGALAKVLSNDKKTRHLVPTWQDLEVLEAVQKNESLLACELGDSELCKAIKTSIVEYLNSKYSDPATTDLLEMASFVDPRFRATYIPSEKVDALKHRAVLEVETLLADQPPYLHVPTVPEPADGEAAVAPKAKTLASFFKQRTATTTAPTKRGAIENELSSYLQSASVESDTDPLKCWKDHEVVFPALSHLTKKYPLVPATSSPSERVFSCSGNIVTCHKASLNPDAIDRLVFLAQNL
ncbi:E3 SUMO-protein ligase ZBED1-like [Micropterus dolomieu]|uniref:E3 SUMO-protein ligase ZBED1-like n=1 Tax=Micropterus dolomieu TaxID=147949 RepID=UPI001E8CCD49|nr:E3 SUMO-protein ligase ZBED1-like [Micropterus dolomieu]